MAEAFMMGHQGSNSASGGGSYSETTIYSSEDTIVANSIINLSSNYTLYDSIRIEWSYSIGSTFVACECNFNTTHLKRVKEISDSGIYQLVEVYAPGYSTIGFAFIPISTTQFKITETLGATNSKSIKRIVGIINNDSGISPSSSAIKSISWIGTGTPSHSITFPEKPTFLLILQGYSNGGYLQFVPIEYGSSQWNYMWASGYVNGAGGKNDLTYSTDGLTMTMTHSDGNGAAACNLSGVTYILYYI